MAGHNDPRLLYSISGIRAYHIQNGEESSLTPSGPQTLSLLMVPTSSPFADLSNVHGQNEAPEEDFYLHLNLPPELDLPLPATTQIYHQPPRSYLIPRWDLGPENGAFTRIEFPTLGKGANQVLQEDVDTFETILAQCTAFLERASPQFQGEKLKPYNPAEYAPNQGYPSEKRKPGQVVLVDEDNGSVVGELVNEQMIVEDSKIKPGSKGGCIRFLQRVRANAERVTDPVEIQLSPDGQHVRVVPLSEDYLEMARHPAFKNSSMVQNAAAASRLIVTTSSMIGNMMTRGADNFTQKTKPNPEPMTFAPTTYAHVRKINTFTQGAAALSAKTVGQVTRVAQNFGSRVTHRGKGKAPEDGDLSKDKNAEGYKPGFLNKSMIAFSTIADGIEHSGRSLLTSSGSAASTMVGHRFGPEAGNVAAQLAGGVKNVGLVYIDVTGVSRRAIIKSVAKGAVVGRLKGGGEVVVGAGDGSVPPQFHADEKAGGVANDQIGGGPGPSAPGGVVGFGNAAPPPSYSAGVGEPLEGQPAPGTGAGYPPEKTGWTDKRYG